MALYQRSLQWFRWDPERHYHVDLKLYTSMLHEVQERMQQGAAQSSMATLALQHVKNHDMTEAQAAYALSGPWAAGTGTVCFVKLLWHLRRLKSLLSRWWPVLKFHFVSEDANVAESKFTKISAVAMLLYPETMHKAQDELDIVVGSDRLPGFGDHDSLPYVQALIKETIRLVYIYNYSDIQKL